MDLVHEQDGTANEPHYASSSRLLDQIDAFHEVDTARDRLLRELNENYETLQTQYDILKQEITDLKLAANRNVDDDFYHSKAELQNIQTQLKASNRSMETSPFVLVLVDGNAHKFHDQFLQQGALGGADAAIKLREEIERHILQSSSDWQILVRVYVDFQALVEDSGAQSNPISELCLRKFLGGFSQVQPLYDIVDTGPGEKEALIKIKETFDVFITNVQCKHIYYGCALDETSIATLDAYKYDPIAAASITMIKSRAVDGSSVHIPFELMELSSVFRNSDEIDDGATGNSFSGFGDNATSAAGNWSRFAAQRSKISPTRRPARQPPPGSVSTWDSSEKIVLLNINDERVDSELGKIDPKDYDSFMERFKHKRLCHYHYLVGHCHVQECTYTHSIQITTEELTILRATTRKLVCAQLSNCRNINCIYGHLCPYMSSGYCRKADQCHFRAAHHVDRTAVRVWTGHEDEEPETHEPEMLRSQHSSKGKEPVRESASLSSSYYSNPYGGDGTGDEIAMPRYKHYFVKE